MSRRLSTRSPSNMQKPVILTVLITLTLCAPAFGYIGPGAGFAVLGSFMVFFLAMLSAIATLFTWPIRWVVRGVRGRRAFSRSRVKRVVVLGIDGMDPSLTEKYMAEGQLPHLSKLAEMGCYTKLRTTIPAMTPVAWSTFLTGCNPGKHNIFDFLDVDRRNYMPTLSSVHIGGSTRTIKLGKYLIPIGKPDMRLLRKGKPFWATLGEHGIFSNVIRMPITFPPEGFRGTLLSGMCVPDLRGTQGTFSYYTTKDAKESIYEGGEQHHVTREGNMIHARLVGPPNGMRVDNTPMQIPFTIRFNGKPDTAKLTICGYTHLLKKGEYTSWVKFHFKAAPGSKVNGICQFLLLNTEPDFELYVTPLQIDPEKPAMPISHPAVFSTYLSKLQGPFATMGLAEDTWAHNERILDDSAFLHQSIEADEEREVMFFDALDKVKRGMVACVFDGQDRVQHMFWRYIDESHPAHEGFGETKLKNAITEQFQRMDNLVGKTMAECDDPDTLLLVISDHGCKSFRHGVDLNRWLIDNGYLTLKEPANGRKYLSTVDWSKTKAYAMGLTGIFLNIADRESQGIVQEGVEANALRRELCERLSGLVDDRNSSVAINKVFNARECYVGPYVDRAPDVIIGYNEGYRVSWETAIGEITDNLFLDNKKAWSGDHCIDPRLAPGVMFSNRRIDGDLPHIMDLAPTILDLFGVAVPTHMDGKPLQVHEPEKLGAAN